MKRIPILLLLATVAALSALAEPTTLAIHNDEVELSVVVDGDRLVSDRLETEVVWSARAGAAATAAVETDADFALDVMFTDWQAPGKIQNAENPAFLTKKDFALTGSKVRGESGGRQEIELDFRSTVSSIEVQMVYRLDPHEFFARRSIAVRDLEFGHHFLRWLWTRDGSVGGLRSIVKSGGFGQPVALLVQGGGAFFGLEYPTAENHFAADGPNRGRLRCGQEIGELIADDWIRGEWVVMGATPSDDVKLWFFRYVDTIRVAPLRPYTLYNSWYDLRSPDYPGIPPENVMSEPNAIRMARILREKMVERHGIRLDAFVLDDGWDVYSSDWMVREKQWPNGFKPLSDELAKTQTRLGIWIGPTGGYSCRMDRINWMRAHGYEVVGRSRHDAMLCVAGTYYSALLRKRVADFVTKDGVGYFKWDGFQFSCSEPDHGHPVGIYSRRAVMQSVIALANTVRDRDPGMFLNITSGTWLSPWWVKVANTIWMQGEDYGYSDVPSISQRDAAITYRDFILYDDFRNLDLWFPIANLMTHGIIKGKLEMLGSPEEPLDKFTDDVLLYVARGISMYELYVSPDILSDGEWTSISEALQWARDRFPTLMSTTMIGGNPMKREPYGYAHFKGSRGIVAVRNPFIAPATIDVALDPAEGLDTRASSLVVERVYPTRWIAPELHKAGDVVHVPLDGYETAVYEIYPIAEATEPLLAGATFDVTKDDGTSRSITIYGDSAGAKLLNPEIVTSMKVDGHEVPASTTIPTTGAAAVVGNAHVASDSRHPDRIALSLDLASDATDAEVAVLLTPDEGVDSPDGPKIAVRLDRRAVEAHSEDQESRSRWFTFPVEPGSRSASIHVMPPNDGKAWHGTASVWLVAREREATTIVDLTLAASPKKRVMPPIVWKPGEVRVNVPLGEAKIATR